MSGEGASTRPTFFFMHVMKTGGTSLLRHIHDNFPAGEVEPDYRLLPEGMPPPEAHYASLIRLWELDPGRRAEIRVYTGHYPFWATELIEPDVTFTVLRDPVDRTISLLRQLAAEGPPGSSRPIEELYDDPPTRRMLVQDYQAKQLGMSREDWEAARANILMLNPDRKYAGHLAHVIGLPIDDVRLARAKANLASFDLVGLQTDLGVLLDGLRRRYGWRIPTEHRLRRAAPGFEVPDAFRRRIAAENQADVELWESAVELVEERRRADA